MRKRTNHSDPTAELIRANLKRFRNDADLSQQAAAEEADILVESLRRYERGTAGIDAITLAKLGKVYGHDPGHFYMQDPPPANLDARPVYFLRVRGDAEVSETIHQELLRIVATANARQLAEGTPGDSKKKATKR